MLVLGGNSRFMYTGRLIKVGFSMVRIEISYQDPRKSLSVLYGCRGHSPYTPADKRFISVHKGANFLRSQGQTFTF